MFKEYKAGLRSVIKNPRISVELLGLKCVCGRIDVVRGRKRNGEQAIKCKTCNQVWRIPKLDIKHRLSKRKFVMQESTLTRA
jgi:uncharacterized C2H2 Zn-finger protein